MKFKRLTAVFTAAVMALTMVTAAGASAVPYDTPNDYTVTDDEDDAVAYSLENTMRQLLAEYPDGSYYSKTRVECSCHGPGPGNNPCHWNIPCDCIKYDNSIQCLAFAKYVYYNVHGYKWSNDPFCTDVDTSTAAKAKSVLKGVPAGTYVNGLQYGTSEHAISIINTTEYGVYVYEANYDGHCRVRYDLWTWEKFAYYMPYIYKVVK